MRVVCWEVSVLCIGALLALAGEGSYGPASASAQSTAVQAAALVRPNDYASQQRSRAAVGHYSRARTMCIESLEEFEVGRKYARPDLLVDPEEWRLTMISLCEQLNRLIDPKMKIDRGGIYVSSNPRLIRRAKDQLPTVADGPKDRNDYGDKQFLQKQQEARASLKNDKAAALGRERAVPAQPAPGAKQSLIQKQGERPKASGKGLQPVGPDQSLPGEAVNGTDAVEAEEEELPASAPAQDETPATTAEMKKSLDALRGTTGPGAVERQAVKPSTDKPAGSVPAGPNADQAADEEEEEAEEVVEDEMAPPPIKAKKTAEVKAPGTGEPATGEPVNGEPGAEPQVDDEGEEISKEEQIVIEGQPAPAAKTADKPASSQTPPAKAGSEDEQIAQAIEDAISKRVKALEAGPKADPEAGAPAPGEEAAESESE